MQVEVHYIEYKVIHIFVVVSREVDVTENNVWALFVQPEFEGRGAGKQLHEVMLQWYFQRTDEPLKLTTAPGTRAELFYRLNGWQDQGKNKNGEIVFQMQKARIRG